MAERFDLDRLVADLDTGKQPQWIIDHMRVYLESGGKRGHMFDASFTNPGVGELPTLLLTTMGRKTGKER